MSRAAGAGLTLVLIRHGQTEWNRQGWMQGQHDVPLDETGRTQAAKLARRLAAERYQPGTLLTSDLSRAAHTAAIVAEALGAPAAEPRPEWRERNLGAFTGKTRAWLEEHEPEAYAAWRADPVGYRPAGGESYRDHRQRIERVLAETLARHREGRLTIVTHGGCAYSALAICHRAELPPDPRLKLVNTSINEIRWTEATGWQAVRVNDAAHLDPGERSAE